MPDGSSHLSPPLAPRQTTASSSYINAATGLSLTREEQSALLNRMSVSTQPNASDSDILDVEIPCTRPDILHECDIMEDLAIAYGYNNLPQSMPTTNTVAKQWPVNKLADLLRKECAMAGWTEALPLILVCSHFPLITSLDSSNTSLTSVLPRRELQIPQPPRSWLLCHRPRQPRICRIPDRPNLPPSRSAQDPPRKQSSPPPHESVRGVRRRYPG